MKEMMKNIFVKKIIFFGFSFKNNKKLLPFSQDDNPQPHNLTYLYYYYY